jgi:hypothetical protein
MNLAGAEYVQVTVCCEHGNGTLSSVKRGYILTS